MKLLNTFIDSNNSFSSLVDLQVFSLYKIMSFRKKHPFTWSITIWVSLVYFSCLIAAATISSEAEVVRTDNLYLVLDSRDTAFIFGYYICC
jgi:hypothetical protein